MYGVTHCHGPVQNGQHEFHEKLKKQIPMNRLANKDGILEL